MTYRVIRHPDNTRVFIELDGMPAFELEREKDGLGIWALYRVRDGVRGAKIDRDQYSNDLIERVTCGLIRAGRLAKIAAGYVVEVPAAGADFYVSGTGFLCCRSPVRMVLTEAPVTGLGLRTPHHIRRATPAECAAAGLDVKDPAFSAVVLESE